MKFLKTYYLYFVTIFFTLSNCNNISINKLLKKKDITPVLQKNRENLSKVKCWIDDNVYKNSIYNYGLPPRVRHLIDLQVGNETTYSDLLVFLSQFLNK